MNNKELTEGLQEEKKALELSAELRKTCPDFMEWMDAVLRPFDSHGLWLMTKYKEENK